MGTDCHFGYWHHLLGRCFVLLDQQVWIFRGLPHVPRALPLVCGLVPIGR